MWEGGFYQTFNLKRKDRCTLSEFAVLIFTSEEKPDTISSERWAAMLKWREKRIQEGLSIREIIALEDGFYND
jgi:hypothetical protein